MAYLQILTTLLSPLPCLAALWLVSISPAHGLDLSGAIQTGPVEVVDGDGLRLNGKAIRLHGIDAPEREQTCRDAHGSEWPCGTVATNRLAMLIRDNLVTCTEVDRDRYDRVVALCKAAGVDLGGTMVAEGLAWAYLRYSDSYNTVEASARQQAIGIWAASNQPPWEYRETAGVRPSKVLGCLIKGNISQSGARIYHSPGGRSYAATRISEANGERWFCSEEEARTAGWRAPRG